MLQAATPSKKLVGRVGPGFSISLKSPAGSPVLSLLPGTYALEVRDLSAFHSFHLVGPGVDRRTAIATTSTSVWPVVLRAGTYRIYCDAHPRTMVRVVRVLSRPTVSVPSPAAPTTGGGSGY